MNYHDLIKNETRQLVATINDNLGQFGRFIFNDKHIHERMQKRNLHLVDLKCILDAIGGKLSGEIEKLLSQDEDSQPWRISVSNDHMIVVLSKIDDNWKINTVLDPMIHNKFDDEKSSNFYAFLTV